MRVNAIRDIVALGLLVLGLLLPWNLRVGITIGIPGALLSLLVLATLLSLTGLALTHVGPLSTQTENADHTAVNRARLLLNVPYLVMATGYAIYAVVQSFATGSSVEVPPGIGPGAYLGLVGALLAAQPMYASAAKQPAPQRMKWVRIATAVLLALGAVAVVYTLYQRTRFVLPGLGEPDIGAQNATVALTALLYAVVALLPLIIVARWIFAAAPGGSLAAVLIAASVLVAGTLVWMLPAGRELDAFHGISQSTSTAGVGYEGFLAWTVTAALVGTFVLTASLRRAAFGEWTAALRKVLLLVAVWCGGTALMRISDVLTSAVLDLPTPPYNATALMAADLLVAVLALWIFVNTSTKTGMRPVLVILLGVVMVGLICRLVLGVALVPRVRPFNPTDINEVYGNTLAQQITGLFDVALSIAALTLVVAAVIFLSRSGSPTARHKPLNPSPTVTTAQPPPSDHTVPPNDMWAAPAAKPTIAVPAGQAEPPGLPSKDAAAPRDRASEVLAESTQRFAAGTTYGDHRRVDSQEPHTRDR
ncbi:hypothetical protein KXD98_05535 [Mycobacterium sp. SMC-4]|nr:hypothetical protein KXD98_05535 [Mycobacterium sp. SMC-4]